MAAITIKNTLTQRKRTFGFAAIAACLRCWCPSIDLDNLLATFLGNVLGNQNEISKAKVGNLATPASLHARQAQVFNEGRVEAIKKSVGSFELPVTPLVRRFLVCFRKAMLCFLSVVATFLFTCQIAIANCNSPHVLLKKQRAFNGGLVVECEERFQSEICAAAFTQTDAFRFRILNNRETNPQTIHVVPLDRDCFDAANNLARLNKLVIATLDSQLVRTKQFPSGLLEGKRLVFPKRFELWWPAPWALASLQPLEEPLVGFVESLNDVLCCLGAHELPVFISVSEFGNLLLQLRFADVLTEHPIEPLLQRKSIVPNLSRCVDRTMQVLVPVAFVHSVFESSSHGNAKSAPTGCHTSRAKVIARIDTSGDVLENLCDDHVVRKAQRLCNANLDSLLIEGRRINLLFIPTDKSGGFRQGLR